MTNGQNRYIEEVKQMSEENIGATRSEARGAKA
jgi:hypothetical protein